VTSQGALLPPMYYRGPGGMGVTCTEGNEEKWFRSKEVQHFETRDAKSRSAAAQKKLQSERGNSPPGMPIYIGAFFPRARGTRVESPGGIAVEGST
jgi:hypothetical protein